MTAGGGPGVDLIRLAIERAGHVRFRARGSSMRPGVRDGDVVSVVRVDAGQLTPGDVICYEPESGGLTVHRLVGRIGSVLITKGDARRSVEHVPGARLLGRVERVERPSHGHRLEAWLGRLVRRVRHP